MRTVLAVAPGWATITVVGLPGRPNAGVLTSSTGRGSDRLVADGVDQVIEFKPAAVRAAGDAVDLFGGRGRAGRQRRVVAARVGAGAVARRVARPVVGHLGRRR